MLGSRFGQRNPRRFLSIANEKFLPSYLRHPRMGVPLLQLRETPYIGKLSKKRFILTQLIDCVLKQMKRRTNFPLPCIFLPRVL